MPSPRGAAAVLWERDGFSWNDAWRVPNLAVDGLRGLAGHLAHEVYGRPSERLWLAGVTGTNGKTSCSHWIAQALQRARAQDRGDRHARQRFPAASGREPAALAPSLNTTPDAIELHRRLAEFLQAGAQGVVMEVSSVGLDQGRVNGVQFDVALLTNLSRDHLDYHGDMERYAAAKAQLFDAPGLSGAVLNMDDVLGVRIAQKLGGSAVARAGYSAHAGVASAAGLEFFLEAREHPPDPAKASPSAVVSSWGRARSDKQAARPLQRRQPARRAGRAARRRAWRLSRRRGSWPALSSPPGRMQRLGGAGKPLVVVDYAHTPGCAGEGAGKPAPAGGRGRRPARSACSAAAATATAASAR